MFFQFLWDIVYIQWLACWNGPMSLTRYHFTIFWHLSPSNVTLWVCSTKGFSNFDTIFYNFKKHFQKQLLLNKCFLITAGISLFSESENYKWSSEVGGTIQFHLLCWNQILSKINEDWCGVLISGSPWGPEQRTEDHTHPFGNGLVVSERMA